MVVIPRRCSQLVGIDQAVTASALSIFFSCALADDAMDDFRPSMLVTGPSYDEEPRSLDFR
jgi:hypothetical protein